MTHTFVRQFPTDTVTGEDFIGRKKLLNDVLGAIWDRHNLSVYGMSRIGKSSLVKEALRQVVQDPSCVEYERAPVVYERTMNSGLSWLLFTELANKLEAELAADDPQGDTSSFYTLLAEVRGTLAAADPTVSDASFSELCEAFYNLTGRYIWIVLDEMDHAGGGAFGDCVDAFRAVVSNCHCVRTINISRDALSVIFPKTGRGSSYPGVVSTRLPVTGWTEAEREIFRARFAERCPTAEAHWDTLCHYGGDMPHLLVLIANHLITQPEEDPKEYCLYYSDEYRSAFKYWCEWFGYRDFLKAALTVATGGTVQGYNPLVPYGIVRGGAFTVPYFAEYLRDNYAGGDMDGRLAESYAALLEDVTILLNQRDRCLESPACALGADTRNNVIRSGKALQAMQAKIICVQALAQANSFVTCDISEAERASFKSALEDIRKFWNKLLSGGRK